MKPVLLTICITLGLCACSAGPVLLTPAEAQKEYENESKRIVLPTGTLWKESPKFLRGIADNHRFEKGVGEQSAQLYWYCTWAKVAYAINSPSSQAIKEISKFPEMSIWQFIDENGKSIYKNVIISAEKSDIQPLSVYLDNNCEK